MTRGARIERAELFEADAGWQRLSFLKLTAADGTTGWAEFSQHFAAGLAATLGPMQAWSVQHKPVSTEFIFVAAGDTPGRGGARVVSRWFAGGRTCDLLRQFGRRQPEP